MATVQEEIRLPARATVETFTRDHGDISLEAEAIRREQLTIWKYEWILPRSERLRGALTAHIRTAEEEIFNGLSRGALAPDAAARLVRQDHELIGQLSNMEVALRIHDGLQFGLALQGLIASLAVHQSLEREELFPTLDGPSPGPTNWSEQSWVYLETTDGRKFTGYLNEQDGEYVYLHFTRIWDKTSDWLDRWTWTEKNGELPSLDRTWGCTGVKKAAVRVVKSIGETYPGDVGRCWVCGRKVNQGHLCSSECEEAYNALANKK
ncbi:MAG: hemerythrin domain-containing protein [Nitrososphaerota archaeon]|nr:hemerythrin domain-containing protein [Nitrososphaerota archaeon]MDG7023919.1 hemerythrin domain-containing protein [Nitrososphaerota archaeon]